MPLSTFLATTVASTITALLGSNTRPVTAARSPCAETEAASPNMVTIVKTMQTTEYRLVISLPTSQDFPAGDKVTVSQIFLHISREGGTCTKDSIPPYGVILSMVVKQLFLGSEQAECGRGEDWQLGENAEGRCSLASSARELGVVRDGGERRRQQGFAFRSRAFFARAVGHKDI